MVAVKVDVVSPETVVIVVWKNVVYELPVVLKVVLEIDREVATDVVVVVSAVLDVVVVVVELKVVIVVSRVTAKKFIAKSARVVFPVPV